MKKLKLTDLRQDTRYFALGRILDPKTNKLLGFLSDLSQSGAQFWIDIVNKDIKIEEVLITPMEQGVDTPFIIKVEEVRRVDFNEFVEVGVKIHSVDNKENFERFIEYLQTKDENKNP